MKSISIYLIKNNDVPVYIGASINPVNRFKTHRLNLINGSNNNISYMILEVCDENTVSAREVYWMRYYKKIGYDLLNKIESGHPGKGEGFEYDSVKISAEVVQLVRQNKQKTRTPVGAFFEMAAMEKLKKKEKQ